ncbi:Cmc1 superfamily domain-containing protein [Histoplasma ohiense]|nr:Cmc1 superfamily domain-containing protein [Histoplasma ohiense (nom. inval.)]
MAASSPDTRTTPPAPASTASPANINLRNPLPLSAAQEAQVRDLYYKRVRGHCAAEIKEFAACAINRTVTATWVCRKQRLAMNACMVEHAKPEEEDRAREEWFTSREERRRNRELEEKMTEERRREVIQMMRDDEERRRREEAESAKGKKGWFG